MTDIWSVRRRGLRAALVAVPIFSVAAGLALAPSSATPLGTASTQTVSVTGASTHASGGEPIRVATADELAASGTRMSPAVRRAAATPPDSSVTSRRAPTYGDINGVPVNSHVLAFNPFSDTGSTIELYELLNVGYYGANDASYPRVGDIFYVNMFLGNVSTSNPSAAFLTLSADTSFTDIAFAISNDNPVYCFLSRNGGAWSRFTQNCSQTPIAAPGGQSFDAQPIGPGAAKMIRVPVYVKSAKSGIGSGRSAQIYATATNTNSIEGVIQAKQSVFVAPRAIEYYGAGVPSLSNSTATLAISAVTAFRGGAVAFRVGNGTANNCTWTGQFNGDPLNQTFYYHDFTAQLGFDGTDALTMCWQLVITPTGGVAVPSPVYSYTRPTSGTTSVPPTTGPVTPGQPPTTDPPTSAPADKTPPVVAAQLPTPATNFGRGQIVTAGRSATFRWTASDPSGLRSIAVQKAFSTAPANPTVWVAVPAAVGARSLSVPLAPGRQTCVRVRATDNKGNVSRWSVACTTTPRDDRTLTRGSGWASVADPKAYLGTVTTSKTRGARLTLGTTTAAALAVVVRKAPGAGTLGVYVGTRRVALLNLAAPGVTNAVVIKVPATIKRSAVVLRVETPGRAGVIVDGLALL